MQNSQLFRRGVVVPVNQEAEMQLRDNEVDESTQVRLLEITSQALFDSIWASGIFQRINHRTGSLIDDYEEAVVESDCVSEICNVVRKALAATELSAEHYGFLANLLNLAEDAKMNERPVFFIL